MRASKGCRALVSRKGTLLNRPVTLERGPIWLQVGEVTTGSGTITLNYDTAPLKDESLFVAMGTTGVTAPIMSPPTLTSVILSALPNQPLARWVRWRITQSGASSTWDLSFRILLAANAVGRRMPNAVSRRMSNAVGKTAPNVAAPNTAGKS